jgi:hypothetical protein
MASEAQVARWQRLVTEGALLAVEATRGQMAAAVDKESGLWTVGELFQPEWWMGAVGDFIIPTLERVAAESIVAAGAEWGLESIVQSDDWVDPMSEAVAGQSAILNAYSDTIANRVEVLAARGNADGWSPEQMSDALGVALEYDALVAAAGPVSNGLASGIGQTESHSLIQASPMILWLVAGWTGTKTWVCTFQRSRMSHIKTHGQEVPIGEVFVLAETDVVTMYPGDHNLPGAERVSCLCYAFLKRTQR